jgi:hypothetical protein
MARDSQLIDAALVVWLGYQPQHLRNKSLMQRQGKAAVETWLRQEVD